MKTALIMEGGGMRGMFTCGVMDVLMEAGVSFDAGAGISAGAVFGCNYKSGQAGRPFRYNKRYCRDKRYQSLRSLLLTGDLYGADFCYRALPDELDVFDRAAFRENPMAFYVGAFDIEAGKMAYHACRDGEEEDLLWMRASASMPLVSRPVAIDGALYLDGGIADPTPYRYMESLGYRRNVVILTQPQEYRKEKNALQPLMNRLLRRYPRLRQAMTERSERYNRHIAYIRERERAGDALVICPAAPLKIGRTERDPKELERVYRLGRAAAEERLPQIRAFLCAADEGEIAAQKARLRRQLAERLSTMPKNDLHEAQAGIREAVLASAEYQSASSLFVYVSVEREPDTRVLIQAALQDGKKVYVPRCQKNGGMEAVRIRSMEELSPGLLSIPEPLEGTETAQRDRIDLILAPCVSAARDGRRLGHGAGYYDGYLSRPGGKAMCLCYERMLCDEIPMGARDAWMDALATEKGIFPCAGKAQDENATED